MWKSNGELGYESFVNLNAIEQTQRMEASSRRWRGIHAIEQSHRADAVPGTTPWGATFDLHTGRPSKKTFQLSLVQGDMYLYMYLTWKGKRTSIQGVELASVIRISRGRDTDVLRRTGKGKDDEKYLSLVTQDRSLDLCFDDEEQRELWWRTMTALVDVEREVRAAASGPDSPPPPPPPNAPKPP